MSTERKTIAGPYRGNNFVTPIKTPAKGGFVPPTTEKRPALDKKWAIEESGRITEYLRQADVGKDFYSRADGIRSMSTKDLVCILNFFLSSVGNRLEIKSAKDYVEETIKSMDKLKYPYNITKSSLKTPTAPHSFTNIVQLLSWLKNLHMHQNQNDEGWEDEFLVFREDLYPYLETQKYIQSVSTESFKIWNSNQGEEEDQFGDIEDKAISKIIHEKTGIQTIADIMQRNKQTWQKCENLLIDIDNVKIPEEQEQKLSELVAELENFESEINVLEMNIKQAEGEISEIQNEIERFQIQGKEIQIALDKLKNAINGQKATVQERDSQVHKIVYLEAKVNAAKNTIKEIQETSSNDLVKETRLLSKIPIMIGKLKDFMNRVQDLIKSNIFENISLTDNKNFQELLKIVKQIQNILNEAERTCQKRDSVLKQKIAVTKKELNALDHELSAMNCEFKFLVDRISALEIANVELCAESENLQEFCTITKNKQASELESKDDDLRNQTLMLEDTRKKVILYFCSNNFVISCLT